MAKVGFWLRGAKGKLAGATHYKSKVGTVSREIVTPTNAKTYGQMIQRAKFANVIKLFKCAQASLYKFAFENKTAVESDYNAFVRINLKRAIAMPMEMAKSLRTFSYGNNFVIADGSLPNIDVKWDETEGEENVGAYIDVPGLDSQDDTIGALSAQLISQKIAQQGDILTVVVYHRDNVERPYFDIQQMIVDTADERPLTSDPVAGLIADQDKLRLFDDNLANEAAAAAVILSRQSPNGLLVSHAELIGNANYNAERDALIPDLDSIATSWGAKPKAVLQGAIAEKNV